MSAAKSLEEIISEQNQALSFYKKRVNELSGENIKSEYRISGLRKEIKQKRSGFAVLSKLQVAIGNTPSVEEIFKTTVDAISQTLDVDRVFILTPSGKSNFFSPVLWQGLERLSEEQILKFKDLNFEFPEAFSKDTSQFMLFNRDTPPTPLSQEISSALDLPFFVCTPIIAEQRPVGIILMGRLKEAGTAFPALDSGDIETLSSISGLVSAVVQNMRVAVLQETDRLKTEFFANISHEFRTPITLTIGPLEGVLNGRYGELTPKLREEAERMLRNQKRLLGLVTQILDLAKMESGGMKLEASHVPDLNRFVQSRVDQFLPLAEKKGIELAVQFDEKLNHGAVYIDQEKMDKVIFNLLSNASKFTKKGKITTRTICTDSQLIIQVEDSGIGIRSDQIQHIFDRFKQADGSASREFAGTGIGLSLVKEIVELHGGTVDVTSEYGKGSIFSVTLPLGKEHLPSDAVKESSHIQNKFNLESPAPTEVYEIREGDSSPEMIAEIDLRNEQTALQLNNRKPVVFYCDDNKDLRDFVFELLSKDYNVLLGVNGKHGYESCLKYDIDLILSDLMMPVWTGTEFLNKAKDDVRLKNVPFVILTARNSVESKIGELERGADDYLGKPFSEVELLARIKNLIKIRSQQQQILKDLRAAREIQHALLPQPTQSYSTLDIEVLYRPCDELSGDFFDIIQRGSWVYFYVVDVTSHGTAAAQVTYLMKTLFEDTIHAGTEPPKLEDLMAIVGERYQKYNLSYAVGAQVCRYHLVDRELEYCSSNAPAALTIAGTKVSEIFIAPGPLLMSGFFEKDVPFPVKQMKLEPQQIFYFFSDGSIEFPLKDVRGEFGTRRFKKLLQGIPRQNWQEECLKGLIEAHGSQSFPDDMTILRILVK